MSGQCQATVTRSSTRDLLFGCRVAAFTDKKKKTNTNTRYCSLASSPSSSTTASWPQLQRRSRSHPHSASTTLFPPLSPPLPRGLALLVRIVTGPTFRLPWASRGELRLALQPLILVCCIRGPPCRGGLAILVFAALAFLNPRSSARALRCRCRRRRRSLPRFFRPCRFRVHRAFRRRDARQSCCFDSLA